MSSSPSSSNVFLQIRTDYSCSEPILAIYLGEKLLEEHFISKLCFSWPHVSCVLGFPARASRIILVSYRDCVGQLQKFALRFSTICQTEKFMKSLKDILNVKGDKGFPSERSCSEISCFAPSNRTQNRDGEKSSFIRPTESCCPEMLPSLTYEVEHCSNSPENGLNYSASRDSEKSSSATPSEVYVPQIEPSLACEVNHNADDTFAALPPSFASLLSNCYSQATQAKPAMSVEDDLKSQIMKCLEDSSFQDILSKVEKIVNGLGDDFML